MLTVYSISYSYKKMLSLRKNILCNPQTGLSREHNSTIKNQCQKYFKDEGFN